MFIGVYTIPVLITYLGLLSSILAARLSIEGEYKFAIILFMLAATFDLFDGLVARKLNKTEKENLFGIQIDSIVDVCSFGVVPAIMGYSMGMNTILDFIILLLYIFCSVMRLSYFNYLVLSTENNEVEKNPRKYYLGLPVTYSTIILPIVFVLTFLITQSFNLVVLRSVFVVTALLFVLNIKIPKPTGKWYIIFPILTVLWSILTYIVL